MKKSSPSATLPKVPTYYNGNKGSRYVPSPLDTHLVAHEDLTANCWMTFGCIHCIKEQESYDILEQPISISIRRNGFGTIVKGTCCRGHKFSIGEQFETRKRVYKRKIEENDETVHKRQRCVSNDFNVLFTLGTILSGIGQTETSRLAAAVNLPVNSAKIYNTISKNYLYWIITEHAQTTVQTALEEEVKATLDKDNIELSMTDVKMIVSGESKMKQGKHKDVRVGITASTDMGWQKRSSGHRYDSPSGHMFFIGALTKKVIAFELFSKNCSICKCAKKKGKPVRIHPCPKNFSESSKAMEAVGAHKIIESIYLQSKGALYCKEIIADDDSTMKAHCSHAKGLDKIIPEPKFLADPSHRCKVVAKPMYKLANAPKKTSLVTKNDAKRIKFYYSYFIRVNRCKEGVTARWMSEHVWCVLYHLFDDHHLCTSDFCWKKKEQEDKNRSQSTTLQEDDEVDASDPVLCIRIIDTQGVDEFDDEDDSIFDETNDNVEDEEDVIFDEDEDIGEVCVNDEIDMMPLDGECEDNSDSNNDGIPSRTSEIHQTSKEKLHSLRRHPGYYRSMKNDTVVFEQMKEKFKPYTTVSAMVELLHPYDTQTNEGMNTAVAAVAPKHKNYSRSVELSSRIHFIVGMKNVGRTKFVSDILMSCGFAKVPTVLRKFLTIEDATKRRKQIREGSIEFKSNRCEKNVKKATVERIDEIKAYVKGTSYGAFVLPKVAKPKEILCRYKEFGCLIADGHKTARCQKCIFHEHVKDDKGESRNQKEIDKIVKQLWEENQNESNK